MTSPLVSSSGTSAKPRLRTLRTISALLLREMSTTYGRSPGGYIWALLEPIGMIAILSLAFGLLLKAPSLGTSFALFYATGYLPFKLYQEVMLRTSSSVRFSKALLSYPAVTFMDALIARFVLNLMTQLMVVYIILTCILMWVDSRSLLDVPPMAGALAAAALLGLGVGTINCLLFDLYPIWRSLFTIMTRPLFLASGLFYVYEDLPKFAADLLWYNPLIHITGLMRTGVYSYYDPNYISMSYVCFFGLIFLLFGLLLLRRYHKLLLQI